MADFDFNIIYYKPTPEEQRARAVATAKAEQEEAINKMMADSANALSDDLESHNISKAANVLLAAGSCEWPHILPNTNYLISSYKFENGKTTLTLSEREDVGGNGLFNKSVNQYVPILTVTADSCPDK